MICKSKFRLRARLALKKLRKLRRLPPIFAMLLALIYGAATNAQPKIESWLTANGAGVYFVHVAELPIVDIALLFDAGSARDGKRHGLAALVAEMLEEGAGTFKAKDIYRRFASAGAEYGAVASRDRAQLSLRSLAEDASLNLALETLIAVVADPNFPASGFERLRKERLTEIKRRQEKPGVVAEVRLAEELYKNHPYASPVGGYERSVKTLNVEMLKDFYRRYYVANNLKLVFVGSLNKERVSAVAEQIASALDSGNKPPPLPEAPELETTGIVRIDYPSEQTHVVIGRIATKVSDPLNVPLYLGNFVLGGSGFGSWLLDSIRVERGLAYDAHSYFSPGLSRGLFTAAFQTRNAQAEEALRIAKNVLRRFAENGPSQEDLRLAKRSISGGYPLRFISNASLLRHVAHVAFYDLPLDALVTYVARVQAQSRENVVAAFKKRANLNKTSAVLVGKMKKEPQ